MISNRHKEPHKKPRQELPRASTLNSSWKRPPWPKLPCPRTGPIPLNMTRTKIFLQIREKGFLKEPITMKTPKELRDKLRYYHFHRDYDHDNEECCELKYQIKELIRKGTLEVPP
ncbi:hypothetical protein BHE74_00019661 [Ensete ventricosum]|nr:hypothetical protein BHE74_00019661 [Ensete ventricosum]RZR82245.1 hypothetical protein BHM03_00008591 [Ensete ventricosum]